MRLPKLLCFVLLMSFSACGHPPASDGSPEAKIVRQLSQRRVVMLGDFAHGFPLPLQSLIATLTTWLDMVQRGESDQYQLTLFLEEDRQVAELIKQYLKDGNLNPLLDYILPSTTIERLEFYADLRGITTRVALLNSRRSPSEQISFDVEGPEARNVFDTAALTWSAREGWLYFVRDRDSLTASNVMSYLREHPKARALMFFGNGHLIGNMVQKDFSGVLTTEESKGVWLGHYLKKAFGPDQVFTISSVGRTRSRLRLDEFAGKDAFLLSSQVPWKDSPPEDNDLVPDNFDAFVIWDGFIIPGHPLQYVRSQRIADAAIRRLEFLAPYRSGGLGSRFFREAQTTLSFLCDTSFADVDGWKTWLREHPLEGLAQMQSRGLQERIFERSSKALGTDDFLRHIDHLIQIGYDSRVGTPTMSKAEWGRHLTAQWPQIVFLIAIGILWTGYADEQSIAKQYLVEASGQDFKDPSEYLKWWRRKFYGVTY